MPSDGKRSLEELRNELKPDVEAVERRVGVRGAEFVRRCWKLGFADGKEALQAMRDLLSEEGVDVTDEDDIELDLGAVEKFLQEGGGKGRTWLGNGSGEYWVKDGKMIVLGPNARWGWENIWHIQSASIISTSPRPKNQSASLVV